MSHDATAFIKANLQLQAVPGLPEISLYIAHSGSRLSHLAKAKTGDAAAPYWAYAWAGGLALAHHFRAHPELIAGRTVLDLGAGSGLVGIAATMAGATAIAAEIDAYGRAAIALNATANCCMIDLVEIDLDGPPPIDIAVIAGGDVFYNAETAGRMLPFLQRCHAVGITVLIGDPQRRDLPVDQLVPIASYAVGDVGDARQTTQRQASVYRLR
ncbi:methyltransferase [Devosia sp. BSSL-BM10]|uniref:Methyltransferase n=1 Tax=Devosia litorisediminis TaxID=2829817 RepID=A0A942E947_9HYPH|nr:methyltransferase [Devosia litorisediminis]